MTCYRYIKNTAFVATTCFALFGCGAVSDDTPIAERPLEPNISVSSCSDVSDPWADSLVAAATTAAQTSFEQMGDALADGDMSQVRASTPTSSDAMLQQVLAKYPGHCGAQFAKATVTLSNIVNSDELDTLVQLMNDLEAQNSGDEDYADEYDDAIDISASLFKLKAEDVPAALFKGSASLKQSDPVTITRIQNVVESTVMPILDTTMTYLQNAKDYNNFAFQFSRNGRTYEIDKGEIGPALASLKVLKSYLVFFLAHQMEVAQGGTYDWVETMGTIDDLDKMTAAQTAAMDHLVSLFNSNSAFSTIKPEWRTAYAGIPGLLESAITDVQDGLRYGIEESKTGLLTQSNDIYVVGTGTDADVNPADLQDAIDKMERARKYLQGPVTVTYNKGKNSLTFDVPKFFSIVNGYQDLLPYHKINAYNTWDDIVATEMDTMGTYVYTSNERTRGPFYFTDASGKATFGEDLSGELNDLVDSKGIAALSTKIIFPDPTFGGIFPGMTNAKLWETLASFKTIEPRSRQCETYEYVSSYSEDYNYSYEECFRVMPTNPSDLDLLTYYLQ